MVQFKTEDVIRYIYNELSLNELAAFENALLTNWDLQEKVQIISEIELQLSSVKKVSPSDACVNRILDYANCVVAN
jgi:hypothetical protein